MSIEDQQETIVALVQKAREEIKPDNLRLSIGEVISIYNQNELILNPNFQRIFRWSLIQKSRLIESILLGIPLPPIFVSSDKNSIWTVIDGVQRLSSILEFTGPLETNIADNSNDDTLDEDEDEDDVPMSATDNLAEEKNEIYFQLTGLKKLDALNGLTWKDLGPSLQRLIKRHFIDFVSLSTVKYADTKFEMFQRLNTGGSNLSDQEKRNCMIIMKDESFHNDLKVFIDTSNFTKLLKLRKEKIQTDYHIELLLRYLIAKGNLYDMKKYPTSTTLMKEFIDDESIALIKSTDFNLKYELGILQEALVFLESEYKHNVFKKNSSGAFNLSKYEALLVGVVSNLEKIKSNSSKFKELFLKIEKQDKFNFGARRGRKALERFKILNDFSREYFTNE